MYFFSKLQSNWRREILSHISNSDYKSQIYFLNKKEYMPEYNTICQRILAINKKENILFKLFSAQILKYNGKKKVCNHFYYLNHYSYKQNCIGCRLINTVVICI